MNNIKYSIGIVLIIPLTGCVTISTIPDWSQRRTCVIYSGVRQGCNGRYKRIGVVAESLGQIESIGKAVSFPFDFVADTVLLPVSIPFDLVKTGYYRTKLHRDIEQCDVRALQSSKSWADIGDLRVRNFRGKRPSDILFEKLEQARIQDPGLPARCYSVLEQIAIDLLDIGSYNKSKIDLNTGFSNESLMGNNLLHLAVYLNYQDLTRETLRQMWYLKKDKNAMGLRPIDIARQIKVQSALEAGTSYSINEAILYNLDSMEEQLLDAVSKNDILRAKYITWNPGKYDEEWTLAEQDALHLAIQNGNSEMVRLLINIGVDVNAKGSSDRPPLHLAVEKGRIEIINLLIQSGADVRPGKDIYDQSPLELAVLNGNVDIVKFLINRGANVSANCFEFAIRENNPAIVEILIRAGGDFRGKDKNGKTALHHAAEWGRVEIIRQLIDAKADLDATSNSGDTALHIAAIRYDVEVARQLIHSGADVNVRNKPGFLKKNTGAFTGWTPIKIAEKNRNTKMIQLLKTAGAKQ